MQPDRGPLEAHLNESVFNSRESIRSPRFRKGQLANFCIRPSNLARIASGLFLAAYTTTTVRLNSDNLDEVCKSVLSAQPTLSSQLRRATSERTRVETMDILVRRTQRHTERVIIARLCVTHVTNSIICPLSVQVVKPNSLARSRFYSRYLILRSE